MATPRALCVTVLDDGFSTVTGKLKRFYLLEVQEPFPPKSYSIRIEDFDEDIQELFNTVPYENPYALNEGICAYCQQRFPGVSEYDYQRIVIGLLNRIVSKLKVNE